MGIVATDIQLTLGTQRVLEDVSFRCDDGEFLAIVGPSGCGKSSLLRMIARLLSPTRGTLRVFHGRQQSANAPQIGFVFQEATLLPWRTVVRNIMLPLELRHIPYAEQVLRASAARELVGLAESDQQKLPRELSGGMKMRTSLARALVMNPEILLLDEPFAAVDDILRMQLNEQLLELWTQQQRTTILVTHNVSEAVFLGQRVLVMAGKPAQIVDDIAITFDYPRPSNLRGTAEFAQQVNEIVHRLRMTAPNDT